MLRVMLGFIIGVFVYPNPATRQITALLLRSTGDALAPAVEEQDTPRANQKGLERD